jgi:hypothetical protein
MDGTKRYRVRIKGPFGPFVGMDEDDLFETLAREMDEVREEEWELTDEQAARFVHKDGYAYAMTVFREGKPELYLTQKEVWQDPSRFTPILDDPKLSPDRKAEEIQRLIMESRGSPKADGTATQQGPPSDSQAREGFWLFPASLLYPLGAALWMWFLAGADHPPPLGWRLVLALGYGLANLGYLLAFWGLVCRGFPPFRLYKRGWTLVAAVGTFALGTVLVNLVPYR